jgi:hypothetical protein
VSITGSKVISVAGVSHTVFLWTLTRNGYQGASCSWFAENLADGLNFFGGTNGQQDFIFSNVLEWKYPVVAGDSWTCADINFTATDSTFYQGLALERSCISPNSLFNTPAGAFNCIEYKYNLNFPQKTGMTSSGIFEPAGTGLYPDFESVFFKPDLGYLGFIIKDNGVMTAKRYLVSWHLN